MRTQKSWFVAGVLFAKKYFSWLLKDDERTKKKLHAYFTSEYQELLVFSGLEVKPYDILLFSYTGAFLCGLFLGMLVLLSLGCSYYLRWSIDGFTVVLLGVLFLVVPLVMLNLLANYPKTYAKYMQIHSLGDIPEVLSYLVMYLKLVPNLENSLKFAAVESSTTLAGDVRKLMWDMQIRVYHGVDDAMLHFATQWGRWSEYFKRSLHLIRSSIQEADEASRIITLDRALDVSLEGTKDTMNRFANRLHQPTVVLYSIGIMIPLSLVAMLPAVGLVGIKITIVQVFLLYDIFLPLFIFLYTRNILLMRPAAFHPAQVPSDHMDLGGINKKRRFLFSLLIGGAVCLPGFFFLAAPYLMKIDSSDVFLRFISDPDGLGSFFPATLFFIWGAAAAISVYCLSVYAPYKRVREAIKQMEQEFSDALYILGKRLSEEKSPEESFLFVAQTLGDAKISQVFSQTSFNLMAMHTNLSDALFSEEFGSLRLVYSSRIKAIFRLFVQGTQKSQRAVSASLIRIADHLKQLQDVEQKIKDMLYELTSTLKSTVNLFAPLIAGVTLAITMLISRILSELGGTMFSADVPDSLAAHSGTFLGVSEAFISKNIQPELFVLVIGVYLIELVVLLTRFTNGINEGDDKAMFMYYVGRNLPSAVVVFSVTIILAQFFFTQIIT